MVGFEAHVASHIQGGSKPIKPDTKFNSRGAGQANGHPRPQIVCRGVGWGSTPSIFLAGLAAHPWGLSRTMSPPVPYPRLGVGVFTVPPRLGQPATQCECPRSRGYFPANSTLLIVSLRPDPQHLLCLSSDTPSSPAEYSCWADRSDPSGHHF